MVVCLPKSMYYYQSQKDDSMVMTKLSELAEKKPLEGQDKFYSRIRLQGLKWNYKRVCRVYRLMGLNKRKQIKRRLPARVQEPLQKVETMNKTWSMDFMHDTLMNHRKFRTLNIIDDFHRKALSIEANFSFPAESVVATLKNVIHEYGKPDRIRVDNGPEFISAVFTEWCAQNNIQVKHIQPGKPVQNGYI
jgi:putative transposase